MLVNGQPGGTLANGTATIKLPLSPTGTYAITITSDGFQKWDGQADIKAGTSGKLDAKLDKVIVAPPPHHEVEVASRPGKAARILFWTSAVLTAGGVVAFSITGSQVRSIEKEQDAAIAAWPDGGYQANGTQFPNDACAEASHDQYTKLIRICDRGKSEATVDQHPRRRHRRRGRRDRLLRPTRATSRPVARSRRRRKTRLSPVTPLISPQGAGGDGACSVLIPSSTRHRDPTFTTCRPRRRPEGPRMSTVALICLVAPRRTTSARVGTSSRARTHPPSRSARRRVLEPARSVAVRARTSASRRVSGPRSAHVARLSGVAGSGDERTDRAFPSVASVLSATPPEDTRERAVAATSGRWHGSDEPAARLDHVRHTPCSSSLPRRRRERLAAFLYLR